MLLARMFSCGVGGMLLMTAFAAGEDRQPLNAKAIYLNRERYPAEIGGRYHILLESPEGGQMEVPTSREFHSGERFWLRMEVRNPAFVYVLNRTRSSYRGARISPAYADETPRLVFGPQGIERAGLHVIPNGAAMRFDENTGIEALYVVLSKTQLFEIENAFDHTGLFTNGSDSGALISFEQQLASWLMNAASNSPATRPKGVVADINSYVVARSSGQPIGFEVQLRHIR